MKDEQWVSAVSSWKISHKLLKQAWSPVKHKLSTEVKCFSFQCRCLDLTYWWVLGTQHLILYNKECLLFSVKHQLQPFRWPSGWHAHFWWFSYSISFHFDWTCLRHCGGEWFVVRLQGRLTCRSSISSSRLPCIKRPGTWGWLYCCV